MRLSFAFHQQGLQHNSYARTILQSLKGKTRPDQHSQIKFQ
jgi:hypothetical protein